MKYRSSRFVRTGTRDGHRRVELRRIEIPLLPRVVAEELFVQFPPDFADDDVFRRSDRRARLRDGPEELLELKRRQIQSVERIHRVQIDRDRQELSVDPRAHAVLIWTPLGEP